MNGTERYFFIELFSLVMTVITIIVFYFLINFKSITNQKNIKYDNKNSIRTYSK